MNRVLWIPDAAGTLSTGTCWACSDCTPRGTAEHLSSDRLGRARSVPGLADVAYVDTSFERMPIEGGGTCSCLELGAVHLEHSRCVRCRSGPYRPGELAGRPPEEAYELWRGAIVDSMFGCRAPGRASAPRNSRAHGGAVYRFCRHRRHVCPHARGRPVRNRARCAGRRTVDSSRTVPPWHSASIDTPKLAIRTGVKAPPRRLMSCRRFPGSQYGSACESPPAAPVSLR